MTKLAYLLILTCSILLPSCSEEKEAATSPDSSSDSAAGELATKAAKPILIQRAQGPRQKYSYFCEATFKGGGFDGQSFRGEVPEKGMQDSTSLTMREGDKKRGDVRFVLTSFKEPAIRGTLNLGFEGDVTSGKVGTFYDQNGTKVSGALGRLRFYPLDSQDGKAPSYNLEFKEMDLTFTEIGEWEDLPAHSSSDTKYRNVTGTAEVTEYVQKKHSGTPEPEVTTPAGTISIKFFTFQKSAS